MKVIVNTLTLLLYTCLIVFVTSNAIIINTVTGQCKSYYSCAVAYMWSGAYIGIILALLTIFQKPLTKIIKNELKKIKHIQKQKKKKLGENNEQ